MSNEVWRNHPIYDIMCSNKGRIRSNSTKTILSQAWTKQKVPYKIVNVMRRDWKPSTPGNKRKSIKVHTLILEAWKGPRPMNQVACHKDGNQDNNAIRNLEWGTRSHNESQKTNKGKQTREAMFNPN